MVLYHDHPTAGHPGRDKTIRKVQQSHNWIGMRQWIADYVKGCAICQQNKIQMHKKKTPLYKITTTEGTLPFQQITMDLITELPMHKGYNAILTIVDHGCSHAAIFLPCSTAITGPRIAHLYLDNIYRWFGLPTKVISDRGPRFTSHFGKALTERLGIQQNLSSAFHPQTDGLSERKNQWIEQYLRLITMAQPEDWTEWLSITSAVHNNRRNTTTRLSPNQILLGYEIKLFPSEQTTSNNQTVEDRMKQMIEKRVQAIDALNKSAQAFQPPSQYRQGDKVWLEALNLRFPHQSSKLNPKRYGPFRILKEISSVAYRLELPASWRIHDVFHASLLSPYQETTAHGPNFSRPPPDLIDGTEVFEVKRIISHQRQGRSRTLQYLIKWKGYPESDNTWEPATQIHAPDLLRAYHRKRPLEQIKAALTRCSKPISPHWTSPPSSTSSTSTGIFRLHAPLNSLPLTTRTRSWTTSGLDIRSRTKNLSTVLIFPCRPLRLFGPVPPQPTTSVQVCYDYGLMLCLLTHLPHQRRPRSAWDLPIFNFYALGTCTVKEMLLSMGDALLRASHPFSD
jgi:hypothetical protein